MNHDMLWREIQHWIMKGTEGAKIEIKSRCDLNERPGKAKFAKTIAAMANSPGGKGYFIIGVKDSRERQEGEDPIIGFDEDHDAFQRLIQQTLTDYVSQPPEVTYVALSVPGSNRQIGVVIVERSVNKPHELIKESDRVKRGTYIRRGAETFPASAADMRLMMGYTTDYSLIVNFSHPLTDAQIREIQDKTNCFIPEIIEPPKTPIHFREDTSFEQQAREVVDDLGITDDEWQTIPVIINPPGFAPIAAALMAEIHGRVGQFPKILRLRRSATDSSRFEFAEIIQLQRIRDEARRRHQLS